jgi:DNA-binding winged helix-turn-helix (wHTH) protein
MSELEQLRDRVEQLEGVLGLNLHLPSLNLTALQSKIFGIMMTREIVSRDMFLDAIYGDRPEPDPKTIEVHLTLLRRKLSPHGICIRNSYGIGWYLTAADKAKLTAISTPTHTERGEHERATSGA